MPPIISVFCSSISEPGDGLWEQGLECGRLLAEAGFDVATGGYGGLMESVSQGAAGAGARVYGVTAPECFPNRSGANAFVSDEIPAATISTRIDTMVSMSSGFIVLDGSIGTLTEMMLVWNTAYIDDLSDMPFKPIVAVGERWASLVPEIAERVATNVSFVTCAPTAAVAVTEIARRVPA